MTYDDFMKEYGYSDEGIEYLLENKIWITRDHQMLYIYEMETEHIKNCFKMIEDSNYEWREEWLPLLDEELYKRKELL